jgi:hypothetical protein
VIEVLPLKLTPEEEMAETEGVDATETEIESSVEQMASGSLLSAWQLLLLALLLARETQDEGRMTMVRY